MVCRAARRQHATARVATARRLWLVSPTYAASATLGAFSAGASSLQRAPAPSA